MCMRNTRAAMALLLCLAAPVAFSQDSPFTFQSGVFSNMMMQPNVDRMFKRNMELAVGRRPDFSQRAGSIKPGDLIPFESGPSQATTIAPTITPGATVAKLVAHYPPASRSDAERVFRELLGRYPKIEQQFGIPRRDVAGSVAAFLAGSYMAYRNVDFPDEHFKPLVNQMRRMIGGNPEFARASNTEKQEMYEQMAILGMFMASTQMALKDRPNAQTTANMKQTAKGYLEQFLQTDAERVQITAKGLVLE